MEKALTPFTHDRYGTPSSLPGTAGKFSMAEQNHGARHSRKQAIYRKTLRRHSHFYARCSHWSFDRSGNAEPIHWHRERWILAATALLITVLSGLIIPAWASRHEAGPESPPPAPCCP